MKKLRKFLTIGVMVLSVIAMSGIVVAPVNAAASTGDLIKMAGNASVYYLSADGKRYVFPNSTTYFSWYSDFSGVVTIPASELQSYPLGGNVTMRPGTKLVKVTTDPSVYAVEPNGTLRKIQSEAQAAALYGTNWNKRVVDVPDAFFTNYTVGAALANGATPVGSLVKTAGSSSVYYYDGTNYRMFASEAALTANRYAMSDVLTVASVTAGGSSITGAETALVKTSQGGVSTGTVVTGSGLMVSLSSNTASGSTLIYGQANANLATFNFTAANDGAVTVKTLKVKRTGVSSDALLTAAYLYEGANRLTDNATVSANYITFNNAAGLFTVAAGQTKSITVKSNISSTTTDGANVAVSINAASDVTSTGAAVTGAFPLTGNTMSVSSATLATFAFNATTNPSAAGNVDAGQSDYTLWKNAVTIGNRDIVLSSIRLRQIGSVATTDLKDLSFYVDGVKKGTTQQLGTDGYVTFDFSSSPVTLLSGGRTLELRGSIVGGSSKTYSFSLQQATDLVAADSQYNAYVTATAVPATTGTQTVNAGTLTVTKLSDSPSGNITKDASGVTLGKYEFKAYGESMKVEYLTAGYTSNDATIGKLRNGALYANGVQIGSTADLVKDAGGTTYSLGSSLIITPGTPVTVEIRADIYDNDGTNNVTAGDTFVADLITYTNGAQRQSSLGYVNVPSAQVTGGTLTVQTGTISLAAQTTYGNQNVVVPKTNTKLAAFTLTGNNIEDTTINSFEVAFTSVTGATFSKDDLNDVYLKYGSKNSTVKSTVNATGNVWSISETLAKNGNMVIEVWGNIGSTVTATHSMKTSLLVSGTTVGSSQTVTTNGNAVLDGQTLTAQTGSIASSLDATTPVSKVVVGNGAQDLGAFRFTTTNDNYTLTEAVVKVADAAAASNITSLSLKDGANVVATAPISGTSATFSGLSLPVAANSYKVLTVVGNLGVVGFGAGNTGAAVTVTLDSFKANNSQGTETADATDRAGNAIYVYKATPTIATQTLPSTLLSASTMTIAKLSITGNTDTIAWKKLTVGVTKTANPTIAALAGANGTGSVTLYDETDTAIPGTIAFAGLVGGAASANVVFTATNEQLVSGSKTYTLKATIGGAPVAGDSVSTTLTRGAVAYAASAAYTGTADGYNGFVWSDQSGDTTTPTHSLTSADWSNDWLIKNLPTDSQTLSK